MADTVESRVRRMIDHYTPDRVSEADAIMAKYRGNEQKLLNAYISKYGPEPAQVQTPRSSPRRPVNIDNASQDELLDRIRAMMKHYFPTKSNEDVERQLQTFLGKEATVLKNMIKKLGPEPDAPGTVGSPSAIANPAPDALTPRPAPTAAPKPLPAVALEAIPPGLSKFARHALVVRKLDKLCRDKLGRRARIIVVTPYAIFLCTPEGQVKRTVMCGTVTQIRCADAGGVLHVAIKSAAQEADLAVALTPYTGNTSNDAMKFVQILKAAVTAASVTAKPTLVVKVGVKEFNDELQVETGIKLRTLPTFDEASDKAAIEVSKQLSPASRLASPSAVGGSPPLSDPRRVSITDSLVRTTQSASTPVAEGKTISPQRADGNGDIDERTAQIGGRRAASADSNPPLRFSNDDASTQCRSVEDSLPKATSDHSPASGTEKESGTLKVAEHEERAITSARLAHASINSTARREDPPSVPHDAENADLESRDQVTTVSPGKEVVSTAVPQPITHSPELATASPEHQPEHQHMFSAGGTIASEGKNAASHGESGVDTNCAPKRIEADHDLNSGVARPFGDSDIVTIPADETSRVAGMDHLTAASSSCSARSVASVTISDLIKAASSHSAPQVKGAAGVGLFSISALLMPAFECFPALDADFAYIWDLVAAGFTIPPAAHAEVPQRLIEDLSSSLPSAGARALETPSLHVECAGKRINVNASYFDAFVVAWYAMFPVHIDVRFRGTRRHIRAPSGFGRAALMLPRSERDCGVCIVVDGVSLWTDISHWNALVES